MSRLIKAFFYKISKDITFKITLIIGGAIAILSAIIFLALDLAIDLGSVKMLTGHGMLVTSLSPAQNYGIAIPINIVSFVVLEFTQGTIRNKIIAGHSKFKIYASLYISGLILGAALLFVYVGFLTLFGTIVGGFDVNIPTMLGASGMGISGSVEYIVKFVILALLTYTTIISYAVFIATSFRSMGPSIPLVLVAILGLFFIAVIYGSIVSINKEILASYTAELEVAKMSGDADAVASLEAQIADLRPTQNVLTTVENVFKCVDPLYGVSSTTTTSVIEGGEMKMIASMDNFSFYGGIASNLVYSTALFFGGACLFKKRDVK